MLLIALSKNTWCSGGDQRIGYDKRKWKIFDGKSQMLIGEEPKISHHNQSYEKIYFHFFLD